MTDYAIKYYQLILRIHHSSQNRMPETVSKQYLPHYISYMITPLHFNTVTSHKHINMLRKTNPFQFSSTYGPTAFWGGTRYRANIEQIKAYEY